MLGLERNEILRDVDAFCRLSHGALWCAYCYDTKNPKETALFWVNASFAFFLLCTLLGLPSARVNGHSSMASDLPRDLPFSGALFPVVPVFATYFSFSVWCRGKTSVTSSTDGGYVECALTCLCCVVFSLLFVFSCCISL